MIAELCSEMQELFTASFKQINANFQQIFKELFGGGHARLYLSDEANVLESGIEIEVSPPGKVIKNLSALSGGEQALWPSASLCPFWRSTGPVLYSGRDRSRSGRCQCGAFCPSTYAG